MDYQFIPATENDLPMLRGWLEQPHVRKWWGDPVHELALLKGDMNDPNMNMWIISYKGVPFAYAQDYDISIWPQDCFKHLPDGTCGIDMFIGVENMTQAGHGSNIMRIMAERITQKGAPMVIIDPDPENIIARKAYAKAGFKGDEIVDTLDGDAILMIYQKP